SESIIMLGNSITNGNEWCEAFGNNNILNRGISGNSSSEVLARLEPIISGKPKAVFLLIGINDGNNPTGTVNNITAIIDQIQKGSPSTKIYVQSVLPVNNTFANFGQNQNGAVVVNINKQLPAICQRKGVTFVDVWSELRTSTTDNNLNKAYTNDGLHMLGAGYRKWATVIEELVGTPSTYLDQPFTPIQNINHNYINQRLSDFAALPVQNGDVLMLGDYYINTGEWHELLCNPQVKNRGIGIDMPVSSINLTNLYEMLPHVIKGNPSKVFLYCGLVDLLNKTTPTDAAARLKKTIEYIKSHSQAHIYLQSLLPRNNAAENTGVITHYNNEIAKLADNDRVHYINLYTSFIDNNSNKIKPIYASNASNISALGYTHWANLIYKDIDPTILPLSENFIRLKSTINTTEKLLTNVTPGTEMGCYDPAACDVLKQTLKDAKLVLASPTATAQEQADQQEKLEAAITKLKATLVLPFVSDASHTYWYRLSTPDRGNRYLTSNGDEQGATGETSIASNHSQWKFVQRIDNSWDIQNKANNTYLSPLANANTQLSCTTDQPSQGWTLNPAASIGRYIITSGTVQLNQTNGAPVFNWGGGSNLNDLGCQYKVSPVDTDIEKLPEAIYTLNTTTFDGQTPLRLTNEQAAILFKLNACTVVMDLTATTASSTPQYLIGSSNTDLTSQFFGIALYGNTSFGVRYTNKEGAEGYYSGKFANAADALTRHQLVFTMQPTQPNYIYYKEGIVQKETNVVANYPYTIFGNLPAVKAITIGGLITANEPNKYPFKGTIHSLRIYPSVLTATQIASIVYPEDTPSSITPSTCIKNTLTFDGTTLWTNDKAQTRALSIFRSNGEIIQKTEQTSSQRFSLKNVPQGTYIIQVVTDQGATYGNKIQR
ncbi:MAG: GDSL-type esterase/lipase family protein, partial [Bacteroidaceae bacterium]